LKHHPKIASDYYRNLMMWTGIIAVSVMVITISFITESFPKTAQSLAATFAIAFEVLVLDTC
jgi:hypothetical protein